MSKDPLVTPAPSTWAHLKYAWNHVFGDGSAPPPTAKTPKKG